jgi:hypothetical protein
MATIRPKDLTAVDSVGSDDAFVVDDGSNVKKATAAQIVDSATPLASQAEAEAGTDNAKRMSPLRVKQAIDALASAASGSVTSKANLAAVAPASGGLRDLADNALYGPFIGTTSNLSADVEYDWAQVRHVPPTSDTTGASGAWRRPLKGVVAVEDGGTGREAAFSAHNLLTTSGSAVHTVTVRQFHTTVGFGSQRTPDVTGVADLATAQANIASYDDGDLIQLVDGKRYLKTSNTLKRVSTGSMNGKNIVGVGKNSGFLLEAGRPAGEALADLNITDGRLDNLRFHGNNPSAEWGGSQLNPDTDTLVRVKGYGVVVPSVDVRFSGGDGIDFRGVNGVWDIGLLSAVANVGWGVVIQRNMAWRCSMLWTEKNTTGGLLIKPDVNSGDADYGADQTFWRVQTTNISLFYDENGEASAPSAKLQGAYGTQIGEVAILPAVTRTVPDFIFANNPDSTGVYRGTCGSLIGPTAATALWFNFESLAVNNTVVRTPGAPGNAETAEWRWVDAGRGNVCKWEASPDAYVPGARHGNLAINTGASNWATRNGDLGNAVRAEGSLHHPLLDYSSTWTTGPSVLRCTGFGTRSGGTAIALTLQTEASLAASTNYWVYLTAKGEAHQRWMLRLWDAVNNVYYNWATGAWDAGSTDAYRVVHVDRYSKHYRIPFVNDATARTGVRVGINIVGSGEAILGHSWFDTIADSAPASIRSGVSMGTPLNPRITDANRPAAAAWNEGLSAYSDTSSVMQVSTGSAWV